MAVVTTEGFARPRLSAGVPGARGEGHRCVTARPSADDGMHDPRRSGLLRLGAGALGSASFARHEAQHAMATERH
jgi:hypothetical protein